MEAVIFVEATNGIADEPDATETRINDLIKRVSGRLGEQPERLTIFANLQSFAIRASETFINEVMKEPEIARAIANDQNETTS
jgi:predicted DNA-binding protein YlxM (UPF0122 family)